MGLLSKKLGSASSAGPKVQTQPDNNAVAYKWSNQSYTIAQLMQKFKLPCTVQCATESCTVVWSDFQFDLRQPLLLRSRRTARKVHARSIKRKPAQGGSLEEFGPPLAVPEDYDGWFAASPKGESQVTRHFRVEGVARSTARRFLATTKLPAFTTSKVLDDEQGYLPHNVMPGEVLTRVCVMGDDPDEPSPSKLVQEHGPVMECLDEKEEPVLLPLSMRGILYEVADQYPDQAGRVFQISSVVESGNSRLPRILTLVHGEPPVLAFTFTGMLRCYTVFTEETILAGTLDDPESMCLELATDSAARFRLGLNESAIKQTCEFLNAFQICETFGPKFVSGIKVSFSLNPEPSDLEDIDLSFYQNASDAQEVDANNEFEFAWGSVKKAKLSSTYNSGKAVGGADGQEAEGESSKVTSFPMGIPHQLLNERLSGESEATDTSSLPGHRDFTEVEIRELMRLKGMAVDHTDTSGQATPSSSDLELLKENRVRDNPLYYYFENNPKADVEEDEKVEDEEILSQVEKSIEEVVQTEDFIPKDSLQLALDPPNAKGHQGHGRDVVHVSVDVHADPSDDDTEDDLELGLDSTTYKSAREFDGAELSDSSEDCDELTNGIAPHREPANGDIADSFRDITCTPASEYHDDDDNNSSDNDDDFDDLFTEHFDEDIDGCEDEEKLNKNDDHDEVLKISEETFVIPVSSGSTPPPDLTVEVARSHDIISHDVTPHSSRETSIVKDVSKPISRAPRLVQTSIPSTREKLLSNNIAPPTCAQDPPPSDVSNDTDSSHEAVERLNTLIDEVSAMVETSTDRIKESTSASSSVLSSPMVTRSPPDHRASQSPTLSDDSFVGGIRDSFEKNSPPVEENYDNIDAAVSSIAHAQLNIEQEEEEEVSPKKLSPRNKKKKFQSAINFFTGIGDSKSKSKSDSGGVKRSGKQTTLFGSMKEKDSSNKTPSSGPGWLSKVRSQERLNKVLSQDNAKSNRFGSPKVTEQPHHHPHQQPISENPLAKTFTDASRTNSPDQENRNPQKVSPKRSKAKFLFTGQKKESVGSSTTSLSTNYSSSATSVNSVIEVKQGNKSGMFQDQTSPEPEQTNSHSVYVNVPIPAPVPTQEKNGALLCGHRETDEAGQTGEVTYDDTIHGVSDDNVDSEDDSEVETVVEEHYVLAEDGQFEVKRSPRSAMLFDDGGMNGWSEDYV